MHCHVPHLRQLSICIVVFLLLLALPSGFFHVFRFHAVDLRRSCVCLPLSWWSCMWWLAWASWVNCISYAVCLACYALWRHGFIKLVLWVLFCRGLIFMLCLPWACGVARGVHEFLVFLSRVRCLLFSPCDIAAPSIWCCLCTCVAGCSVSFWCCVSAWLYLIALLRFLQWFGLSPHQLARFALLPFAFMVHSGTVILFVSTSLSVFAIVCSCRFHVAQSLACF